MTQGAKASDFHLKNMLEEDLGDAKTKKDCRNCHCLRVCKLQTMVIHQLAQFYDMESLPKVDVQTVKFKSPVQWYNLAWICEDFIPVEKANQNKPTNLSEIST